MTDNKVLSQPMGWRWEGELARKRKKGGNITDFPNNHFSSKPGPGKRFWGIEGCRIDENEVPERLGHLPGPETFENGRKIRFCPFFLFAEKKIIFRAKSHFSAISEGFRPREVSQTLRHLIFIDSAPLNAPKPFSRTRFNPKMTIL